MTYARAPHSRPAALALAFPRRLTESVPSPKSGPRTNASAGSVQQAEASSFITKSVTELRVRDFDEGPSSLRH